MDAGVNIYLELGTCLFGQDLVDYPFYFFRGELFNSLYNSLVVDLIVWDRC